MKARTLTFSGPRQWSFLPLTFTIVTAAILAMPVAARAQIFLSIDGSVDNIYETPASGTSSITGSTPALVSLNPKTNPSIGNVQIAISPAGDMFIANGGAAPATANSIGEYTIAGAPVTGGYFLAPGTTSLSAPTGVAISGNDLFVGNAVTGKISEYNLTTGGLITASFGTAQGSGQLSLAVANGNLYVSDYGSGTNGTVNAYNVSSGAAVTGFTGITGLSGARGLAVSGSNLYVSSSSGNKVVEYNANTGAAGGATNLITTGLSTPEGLAVYGSNLFVANMGTGGIGSVNEYSLSGTNEQTVVTSMITTGANYLNLAVIPEPATYAAFLGLFVFGLVALRRKVSLAR